MLKSLYARTIVSCCRLTKDGFMNNEFNRLDLSSIMSRLDKNQNHVFGQNGFWKGKISWTLWSLDWLNEEYRNQTKTKVPTMFFITRGSAWGAGGWSTSAPAGLVTYWLPQHYIDHNQSTISLPQPYWYWWWATAIIPNSAHSRDVWVLL